MCIGIIPLTFLLLKQAPFHPHVYNEKYHEPVCRFPFPLVLRNTYFNKNTKWASKILRPYVIIFKFDICDNITSIEKLIFDFNHCKI